MSATAGFIRNTQRRLFRYQFYLNTSGITGMSITGQKVDLLGQPQYSEFIMQRLIDMTMR
jgi:hypothetical protein